MMYKYSERKLFTYNESRKAFITNYLANIDAKMLTRCLTPASVISW